MTTSKKTFHELLRGRAPRRTEPRLLRHFVWFDHVRHLSKLNLNGLASEYVDKFARSSLVYKWVSGEALATRRSVERIGKDFPETLNTYNLPLFPLLENRRLSRVQIRNLLRAYRPADGSMLAYAFPNDKELLAQKRFVPIIVREDSTSLLARGDIYGFTAIVALVREAEAMGDAKKHWTHAANMYRAIPAVCRLLWFRGTTPLLRECVETIHRRGSVPYPMLEFDVDWGVIHDQIKAPVHETIREKRPRDPITDRFVDLSDPIKYRATHAPIRIRGKYGHLLSPTHPLYL